MNKFEQVSNVDHQMSVARGVGARSDVGGTLPCDLSHDAFDVTYPPNRQILVKTLGGNKHCRCIQIISSMSIL